MPKSDAIIPDIMGVRIRLQGSALHLLFRDARSLLALPGVESGAKFKPDSHCYRRSTASTVPWLNASRK